MSNWRPRWHSYHGANVDMAKMADQAQMRMVDYREPSSTVIHHHPASVPCSGKDHTVYDHRDVSVTPGIRIDDAYAMWGINDPYRKAPKR